MSDILTIRIKVLKNTKRDLHDLNIDKLQVQKSVERKHDTKTIMAILVEIDIIVLLNG